MFNLNSQLADTQKELGVSVKTEWGKEKICWKHRPQAVNQNGLSLESAKQFVGIPDQTGVHVSQWWRRKHWRWWREIHLIVKAQKRSPNSVPAPLQESRAGHGVAIPVRPVKRHNEIQTSQTKLPDTSIANWNALLCQMFPHLLNPTHHIKYSRSLIIAWPAVTFLSDMIFSHPKYFCFRPLIWKQNKCLAASCDKEETVDQRVSGGCGWKWSQELVPISSASIPKHCDWHDQRPGPLIHTPSAHWCSHHCRQFRQLEPASIAKGKEKGHQQRGS